MPAPLPYIGHGSCGYFEPGLKKQRRIGDLDSLRGVWIDDEAEALMPGDAVPGHPGMIIADIEEDDGGAGSVAYRINALGSLDNASPYKVIGSRPRKSLDATWDSFSLDLYHTRPNEREFFSSLGDVLYTSIPKTFENGDVVRVSNLSAGLTNLSPGIDYHVVAADPVSSFFKLSNTPDGTPISIPSGQSGTIVLRMFARGTQPAAELNNNNAGTFYLYDVDSDITGGLGAGYYEMPFQRCKLNFVGIIGSKPYKRSITVNGKTMSHENMVTDAFPGGGWSSPSKGTMQQPVIEVTDMEVFRVDPDLYKHVPTSDVLNAAHEVGRVIPPSIVIPSPPQLNPVFGALIGDLTRQWPNRWSFVACEKVDEIPGTSVCIIRKVWRYEWPVTI